MTTLIEVMFKPADADPYVCHVIGPMDSDTLAQADEQLNEQKNRRLFNKGPGLYTLLLEPTTCDFTFTFVRHTPLECGRHECQPAYTNN